MVNLSKIKWTPAQTLIFHLLISGLVSAVLTGATAAFQMVATSGFSLTEIMRIFATAFLASLGACYLSIKSNPNLMPAIMDTLQEVRTGVQTLQQSPAVQSPTHAAPLVVVHATTPATPAVTMVQPVEDPYKAPEQLADLSTAFAYGTLPTQATTLTIRANPQAPVQQGTALPEDTMPRSAIGK